MAEVRISELTAIGSVAPGDLLPIDDVSDTTEAPSGSTRKATVAQIAAAMTLATSQVTGLDAALALKALDSAVMHLTGAETIAGAKTFSTTIVGSVSGNAGTATN